MSAHDPARVTAAHLRPPAWLMVLGMGIAVALSASAIGSERATEPLLVVTGLAVSAAILIGVGIHQPARRPPWLLLAVSTFITTVPVPFINELGPVGMVAEVLTVIGSIVGVVGFATLIRGRIPGGDRGAF